MKRSSQTRRQKPTATGSKPDIEIHSLPDDVLRSILVTAMQSDPSALLLTCKKWSALLPPDRCKLQLTGRHDDAVSRALTSPNMRDAELCVAGGADFPGPPADAFRAWTGLSCLRLRSLTQPACLRSLSPGPLRAWHLEDTHFDDDGGRALFAALRAAAALEHLLLARCSFAPPGAPPGAPQRAVAGLLAALTTCEALRSLVVVAMDACLSLATLPQLARFRYDNERADLGSTDPESSLGVALESLAINKNGDLLDHECDSLCRLLEHNASVQELELGLRYRGLCWFDGVSEIRSAVTSMTGVTHFVSSFTHDVWRQAAVEPVLELLYDGGVASTDFAEQLTDVTLVNVDIDVYNVWDVLLSPLPWCSHLTSLVLDLKGSVADFLRTDEVYERSLETLSYIGKCTRLRSLRLAGYRPSEAFDFYDQGPEVLLQALCHKMLEPLRELRVLELVKRDFLAEERLEVADAAPCAITWVSQRPRQPRLTREVPSIPDEYRVRRGRRL